MEGPPVIGHNRGRVPSLPETHQPTLRPCYPLLAGCCQVQANSLEHLFVRFTPRCLSCNAAACALLALAPPAAYAQGAPAPETYGIVVANMDRSVKPGDDFWHYANGDWIKRTELPPDRSFIDAYGLDNDYMNNLTRERTTDLIEEAVKA